MNAASAIHASSNPASPESSLLRLREAAGQVVGSVFYSTMLKTMRESKLEGKYGHGGRGEEVFAAQMHDLLAERMGTAQSGGLAEALYTRLEPQQQRIDRTMQVEVLK